MKNKIILKYKRMESGKEGGVSSFSLSANGAGPAERIPFFFIV